MHPHMQPPAHHLYAAMSPQQTQPPQQSPYSMASLAGLYQDADHHLSFTQQPSMQLEHRQHLQPHLHHPQVAFSVDQLQLLRRQGASPLQIKYESPSRLPSLPLQPE